MGISYNVIWYAPVAQRIRAMGFYPTGRGFDSLPGYQLKKPAFRLVFLIGRSRSEPNPKVRKEGESSKFTCETRTDGIAASLRLTSRGTISLMFIVIFLIRNIVDLE